MSKYLILGAAGLLGSAFRKSKYFIDNIGLDSVQCDITDYDIVENHIKTISPEVIINCAAYTNVDKAEIEKEKALAVNSEAVKNLAYLTNKYSIKLVHFSTDYVFKGDKEIYYNETMKPDPVNFYGYSKMLGEEYVQDLDKNALIIRVSWLYGEDGKNFISHIFNHISDLKEIKIVHDQYSKVTYSMDAVMACKKMLEHNCKGVYHFANDEIISRYEFAIRLKNEKHAGCDVIPIHADEIKCLAVRPKWSMLDVRKYGGGVT